MFRTALVALDRSASEAALLARIPDLRSWGVERIVLAHVQRVGGGRLSAERQEDVVTWLEEHAAGLRLTGFAVEVVVTRSGVPAEDLLAVAARDSCDLVVIGSRSHNQAYEFFLGSVATDVLRRTDRPVLLLHLDASDAAPDRTAVSDGSTTLERVLLATDLSHHAHRAEEVALTFAPTAETIDVLTVVSGGDPDLSRENVEGRLQAFMARLRAAGGDGRARVVTGEVADSISEVADEGYTLIIVGKHGRHWLIDKVLGTTAAAVSRAAKRPVLVVPRDVPDGAAG
ncbi:MAG: universal stress protein [Nitriliruptor sp.]|nr:MAG: universal stress protein [Nitriliruptor sp.]